MSVKKEQDPRPSVPIYPAAETAPPMEPATTGERRLARHGWKKAARISETERSKSE